MKKYIGLYVLIAILLVSLVGVITLVTYEGKSTIIINLTDKTMEKGSRVDELKVYTQDDYDSFVTDYNKGNLDEVYITEFLFDGVSMYKTYDLDDFIDEGNDYTPKTVKITVFNVNTTGKVEFTGNIKGGMIAVNTNNIKKDINILLNTVNIDTDSKKVPAIYVYNKDITYTGHKVTITTLEGTVNAITGGKLKKVSLMPSDDLASYTNKYSGDNLTNYNEYTNYYGVYSKTDIDKVLFAKVTADNEDLADGDPYYFYKGAGAISSDIDLYFEGKGTLIVESKNDEGIETKGNLTFSGGTGFYYVRSLDDALNTTTSGDARNALTIDVNTLIAEVLLDADEGDAIDSNGTITINGGEIIALSNPGSDAGLDATKGTYINGGTVIATGDMYDEISSESKQRFIGLSFNNKIEENTTIVLLDSNDTPLFGYTTDRTYTNLIYSSPLLIDGVYSLYKGGETVGVVNHGFLNGMDSYTKGTLLGYSSTGMGMGMPGNMPQGDIGERPELPSGDNMTPPTGERPELPNGEQGQIPNDNQGKKLEKPDMTIGVINDGKATNKEFTINGISNLFSGIGEYEE